MQEATCFHCRTVVEIAPDDDHCSNCGEDLRGLLDREHVSDFFCDRVAELTAAGRPADALAEAERGLTYHNMAELHLLAAMLAEELERYDAMRGHVAAIPLDDSLRPEAEWLLRAHQDRQRALREGAKHGRRGAAPVAGSPLLADVLGMPRETPEPQRKSLQVWTGVAAVLIVALIMVTWFARGQRTAGVAVQPQPPDQAQPAQLAPANVQDAQADSQQDAVQAPADAGDAVPSDAGEGEPAAEPDQAAPAEPTPAPRLLPIPTPSVPQDLVLPATEAEAIVDSNPRSVVVLSANGFDLARVLRENEYPELAELPIDARLQDGKLVLNGLVNLDLQRRQILEALETVPGIADVSAANLLLRPEIDLYRAARRYAVDNRLRHLRGRGSRGGVLSGQYRPGPVARCPARRRRTARAAHRVAAPPSAAITLPSPL